MKAVETWKVWAFVAGMVTIAFIVNSSYDHVQRENYARERALELQEEQRTRDAAAAIQKATEQATAEQQKLEKKRQAEADRKAAEAQKAEDERRAAEEAAAEHARFLARHVNTNGVARKPGVRTLAIVAATENREDNRAVEAALTNRFKTEPFELLPSLLRPEFVSDSLLNDICAGSLEIVRKLELTNVLDVLVLAHQEVQYVTNSPALQSVLTANMRCDVAVFSVGTCTKDRTWTFTSVGAGFKQADARALAEERLITQLTRDTNMSLPH